jgi:hypothetical protein
VKWRARVLLLSPLLSTACGGSNPSAPSTPVGTPTIVALRITGLPEALSPASTTQLRAEATLSDSSAKECLASWSVDDAKVASISTSGVLQAFVTGYVTVSATCDGVTARVETRVEGPCPYSLFVVAQDKDVTTEFGIAATMEVLDGPRGGQKVATGSVYGPGITLPTWPERVRLTADSFEPRDFVLAESTGKRRNAESPIFDFNVPMAFAPDAWTDTYVQRMSRTEMEFRYPITLAAPGDVSVRTWWSVDYNDLLYVQLWCQGSMLREVAQRFGSNGQGFTERVGTPGSCEVRLRQSKSDASTHYRVAIRYPH